MKETIKPRSVSTWTVTSPKETVAAALCCFPYRLNLWLERDECKRLALWCNQIFFPRWESRNSIRCDPVTASPFLPTITTESWPFAYKMSLPPLFIWLDICVRLCHNWCMTWKRCVHTTHSFMESSLNIMWLDIPVPCKSINSFFYLLQQLDTCYWNSRHVQFCISCHGIYWNEVSVAFDKSHSCYWTAFQCSELVNYYPTIFFYSIGILCILQQITISYCTGCRGGDLS